MARGGIASNPRMKSSAYVAALQSRLEKVVELRFSAIDVSNRTEMRILRLVGGVPAVATYLSRFAAERFGVTSGSQEAEQKVLKATRYAFIP